MKWLLGIAGGIILLVLVIVLIGLLLPKAHRVTRIAHFKQPAEAVFAAITGPQDWRAVTKTELAADQGIRRWREDSKHGSITFEEAASNPPYVYSSRIADKNLPYSGSWTWELSATAEGCTCRITEDGEVHNPIFRFVSQLILGHTKTIDDYLNALGKKFGQPVKIEAAK